MLMSNCAKPPGTLSMPDNGFHVSNPARRAKNRDAYSSPYSGVGEEFFPLGVPPDHAGFVLHEVGYDPENEDWNFPSVLSPFWRLFLMEDVPSNRNRIFHCGMALLHVTLSRAEIRWQPDTPAAVARTVQYIEEHFAPPCLLRSWPKWPVCVRRRWRQRHNGGVDAHQFFLGLFTFPLRLHWTTAIFSSLPSGRMSISPPLFMGRATG